MAKSKKESSPSEPDPPHKIADPFLKGVKWEGEDNHAHVRYAVMHRNGKTFVGHRQYNYRDGSFAAYGPFKNARVWGRRADAEKQVRKDDTVVEVTCAVGAPWSVLTQ